MDEGMRHSARQRGFLMMDIFIGLGVIIILAMVVGMAIVATGKSVQSLADHRAAVREAERVLTQLQQGKTVNHPVKVLEADGPKGMTWVRVEATVEGRSAQLVGIVPTRVMEGRP